MNEIQGKIEIKRKQIQVEKDSVKKSEYQKQLQRLLIKKEIRPFSSKIR